MAQVKLEFSIETDLDNAVLRTSNKLDEIFSYPDGVQKPIIFSSSGGELSPVIWMMFRAIDPNKTNVDHYRTYFDNEISSYLERVPGVGRLLSFGGQETELQLIIDMEKLAHYKISLSEVVARLSVANVNVSAGEVDVSKKSYRLRTVSKFQSPGEPMEVVIRSDGVDTVRLKDIAEGRIGYATKRIAIRNNGADAFVIGIIKEQGANVIKLINESRKVVDRLNEGPLKERGLYINWVYDQSPYIYKAIEIVTNNLFIGALLAVIVLFLFLRNFGSTATIATAIPVSAIGTFIFLWLLDRNLNIISLAGISFAVGMLVDSAIVVLENIDRHLSLGKQTFAAARDGAQEVFGAVFASAMTTVAVFLPIIFIKEEAGQLFRDIAIAVTFAILISLFVSLAIIPSIFYQFHKRNGKHKSHEKKGGAIDGFGLLIKNAILKISHLTLRNYFTRFVTIIVLVGGAFSAVYLLMPKAEYLPNGDQPMVMGILVPPPGLSYEKKKEMSDKLFTALKPHYKESIDGVPKLKDVFFFSTGFINAFGMTTDSESSGKAMIPLAMRVANDSIPDVMGVAVQPGLFDAGPGGGSRQVEVIISGTDMNEILAAANTMSAKISERIPGSMVRINPAPEISYPEVNYLPKRDALLANGISEQEIGLYIDMLMDGRKISEYQPDGHKTVDLVVRVRDGYIESPEAIMEQWLVNAHGKQVQIKELVEIQYSQGMSEVNHYELNRVMKIEMTPPENIPLQEVMDILRTDVEAPLREEGKLSGMNVILGGSADKLTIMLEIFKWNFLLAILITFLLIAALMESFLYSGVIMFTLPFAAAGGFIGLKLVNVFVGAQSFDVLTMLGFVILVGTVVNNAILIVYQALIYMREEGMEPIPAIIEGVSVRIRPIFMSTLTSLLGLFPLVIASGAGSELYRGIGSVVLGGLGLSTIFTLFLIPAVLALVLPFEWRKINRNKAA
jgi:HAE1 family hydrophobic/amphiphilic exporter-1